VVRAYQQAVPLHTYADIAPDVMRLRRGARDILWPGGVRHFAVSSGTVSDGKIIPVTRQMLRLTRQFSLRVGWQYVRRSARVHILAGKHLTLPGRVEPDPVGGPGTWIGEVSGLVAQQAPWWLRKGYQAIPDDVLALPDWEEKMTRIASIVAEQDIRLIAMVPSWALVLFRILLDQRPGVQSIHEIWPHLQVFISGGVALASYRPLLEQLIGVDSVDFIETYGASEGFFSYQDDPGDPVMLLPLHSDIFYEFIPVEAGRTEHPERYTIAHVEPGVRYALCVTTCSGLWSYQVGDIIRFTRVTPPRIEVVGRTAEMLVRYGEALFLDEAQKALAHASKRLGVSVDEFHITVLPPTTECVPAHEWLIESDTLSPAGCDTFGAYLDAYLQRINRHYRIRRASRALEKPVVRVLPQGTFYRWLYREKGEIKSQTKIPRMSEERNVADGVLACAAINKTDRAYEV